MPLTDTQSLLLAGAAARDSGSLYPLPNTLISKIGAHQSIAALFKRGFAEEREAHVADAVARSDGDPTFG